MERDKVARLPLLIGEEFENIDAESSSKSIDSPSWVLRRADCTMKGFSFSSLKISTRGLLAGDFGAGQK